MTVDRTTDSAASVSLSSKRRRRELLVYIFPNLFTTANLFFGFFSVVSAMRDQWMTAASMIILAALMDAVDGRVARLTNTQSAFGEQYDSMSDLVSFGLAPAFLMFRWSLEGFGRMGLTISFLYLACAALRLARFNVLKQSAEKRYFQGLPSPVAAGTIASAVMFYHEIGFGEEGLGRSLYMLIIVFSLGAAMVSSIRYRSFKDLKFKSQQGFGILILAVLALTVFSSAPEKILFPLTVVYFLSGVLGEMARFMRRRFSWFPGKGRS